MGTMNDIRKGVLPVPDLTSALLLKEMGRDLDPVQRFENLLKRRKETFALRQLWRTLRARELRKELRGEWRSRDLTPHHWPPSPPNLSNDEEVAMFKISTSRPFTKFDGEIVHRSLQAPKTDPGVNLNSNATRVCKSAPFESKTYNAQTHNQTFNIKVKVARDGKDDVQFNALNKKLFRSLPNVYDTGPRQPGYITRDITEWKNEVRKVVPDRTRMFVPVHVRPRSMSNGLQVEVRRFPSGFFKRAGNLTLAKKRDYVINPEWPSESARASKVGQIKENVPLKRPATCVS